MKAFHDSRNSRYRAPYGAIELGETVALTIDLWDAPDARVQLRTWIDGQGESLYDMTAEPGDEGKPTRYRVKLTPQTAGVVWYQFIIYPQNDRPMRYGAIQGRFGGAGTLSEWEPPSFKLTVFDEASRKRLNDELTVELDHPLADAVFGFLRGDVDAYYLAETIETLRENYPAASLNRTFGVFDNASCPDVMACLADIRAQRETPFTAEEIRALDASKIGVAKGRLWLASLLQMLLPCEPILAAPEQPVEGAEDAVLPPWDYVDADCEAIVQNTLDLRAALPVFRGGRFRCFAANNDVVGIWRGVGVGEDACIVVNRSLQHAYDVPIPLASEAMTEVISGYAVPIVDAAEVEQQVPENLTKTKQYAMVHLHQLGSAILYFHPEARLEQPMEPGMGVLAHITSLPREDGVAKDDEDDEAPAQLGTLGAPARAFVDWLADAGVRYWQVLPVNPTDEYGSPYAGISAFAGNTRLLEDGLSALDSFKPTAEYLEFCWRESDWLEPYAVFMAIKDTLGEDVPWQDWPEEYRQYHSNLVASDPALDDKAEQWRRLQFVFEKQWHSLHAYANERGIRIVGDMPIYVSPDSADVWANPQIFQLDADGLPAMVAGCPPDAFAEEGQIWGNPIYDWDALKDAGYDWWLQRLERAFDLYDYVRLDHFIGFCRYFSIPEGKKATEGSYRPGPGIDFFQAAYKKFGPLPIIAEDLGMITPAVRTLVAACGFPGMDIVQFVDGNDPLSGYQPRPDKIAYTGTHDNQTLVGYAKVRYPDQDAHKVADTLLHHAATCNAPVVVVPLQDVLGLDDTARMNMPGVPKGNWTWQAKAQDVADASARMHDLVALASASRPS